MYKKNLLKLKKVFLILFVFSLPFEYWDPFGIASFFTVTKMAGFGYAALALLNIKDSFDVSFFKYVRYLILFWIWLVLINMFNYIGTNTVSVFNFTLFQNIILYWLIASDLKNRNIQIKSLLFTFVLAVILMSILLSLGIGVGQEYIEGVSRITFFGNNPNVVGILAGLAIVFSLYFILNPNKTFGKKGYLLLFALPPFVNLLLLSASRGALITTACALVVMLIMNKTTSFKRILQVGFLIIAAIYFMEKLVESELIYKRMTQFIEEGNTAGRGDIWEVLFEVSLQRPLIGFGETGFETEMIKYYGAQKSAHNLFLEILVTTGIIGLSVFLYFLYFHIKKSAQNFRQGDVLKVVLMIFYLTTVVKAGGVMGNKLMWLLLAIIIASDLTNIKPNMKITK
ncbi:MAG: O-antigen ligase family protein [Flavobacteriaceae bacterium]